MDAYPPDYTAHCMPVLALSGLTDTDTSDPVPDTKAEAEADTDRTVTTTTTTIPAPISAQLRTHFLEFDGSSIVWRDRASLRRGGALPFRIRLLDKVRPVP